MLEVVTLVGVVLVSLVYSETLAFLPLLLKSALTLLTWLAVRNIYRKGFGKFYSENFINTRDFIY